MFSSARGNAKAHKGHCFFSFVDFNVGISESKVGIINFNVGFVIVC